jgi:hypothetical protein
MGIVTADGRWLPPLAPNGRRLPSPGSEAAPVFLGEDNDDPGPDVAVATPGWQPHYWEQYYMPRLGRSIWIEGPVFVPTPTPTATSTTTATASATAPPTPSTTATPRR